MGTKGILEGHNTCSAHKESVIIWKQNTLNTRKETTIDRRLDSSRKHFIETNRHYCTSELWQRFC